MGSKRKIDVLRVRCRALHWVHPLITYPNTAVSSLNSQQVVSNFFRSSQSVTSCSSPIKPITRNLTHRGRVFKVWEDLEKATAPKLFKMATLEETRVQQR